MALAMNQKQIQPKQIRCEADIRLAIDAINKSCEGRSYRDLIIEHLTPIKNAGNIKQSRETFIINNKIVHLNNPIATGIRTQADHIIETLLGGTRNGYLITWTLSNGVTYTYDIFENKLIK